MNFNELIKRVKEAIPPNRFFQEHWPENWRSQGNSTCPFHDDDKNSLQVDAKTAYCHGACGKGRSTIDLAMERFGLTTPREATDFLISFYDLEYLRENHGPRTRNTSDRWICYRYLDEHGKLLFEVVRKPGKEFLQRRPDPDRPDKWLWKLGDLPICLYHLDRIVSHQETDGPIFFVEGEKDTDNLYNLGLVATTSPRGAKGWHAAVEKHSVHLPLAGKHVVIIPDNDEPGREYAKAVAATLQDTAASVKILELPGLADKEDVSDFIEKHGPAETKRILMGLVASTPALAPAGFSAAAQSDAVYLTDRGNAMRLAMKFGNLIRFSKHLGWFFYDGRRWCEDHLSQIQGCAKAVARDLILEAFQEEDEDRRKKLMAWAFKSEAASHIEAMIKLLPSERNISVGYDTFDRDPYLLNVLNGTLDLCTGKLRSHDPRDLITKLAPIDFDPDTTCERWDQFILEIMAGDEELTAFLQRLLGYAITGVTKEEVWGFLWGKGANGKSTMLSVIASCLGDYVMNAQAETFMETYNRGVRTDLARLRGARLITAGEPKGKRFDAETLKAFTGQDTITARFLYAKEFEFKPEGKLFLCANHRPEVRDSSEAFWRRILLIPYVRQFTGSDCDNNLKQTLQNEAPGILNWLLAGCLDWQKNGLQIPEKVRVAVEDYRTETDVLADFLETRCVIAAGQTVAIKDLHKEYQSFCDDRGLKKSLSRQRFNEDLMSRQGIDRVRLGTQRIHTWAGIGLSNSEAPQPSACEGTCEMCDLNDACPVNKRIQHVRDCPYYSVTM